MDKIPAPKLPLNDYEYKIWKNGWLTSQTECGEQLLEKDKEIYELTQKHLTSELQLTHSDARIKELEGGLMGLMEETQGQFEASDEGTENLSFKKAQQLLSSSQSTQ